MLYGARIIICAVLCIICIFVLKSRKVQKKIWYISAIVFFVGLFVVLLYFSFEFEKQLFTYTNKYDIPYNQPEYSIGVSLVENDNLYELDSTQKAYIRANYVNGNWYIRVLTTNTIDFSITDNLGTEFKKGSYDKDCWLYFAKIEDIDIDTYAVNIDGKEYTVLTQ